MLQWIIHGVTDELISECASVSLKSSMVSFVWIGGHVHTKSVGVAAGLVCYTAVFSVVTQRFSPQTAAENRTTFLSLCACGLTNKPIMYKKFDNT